VRNAACLIAVLLLLGCSHIPLIDVGSTGTIDQCASRLSKGICKGLEDSYLGVSILVSAPVDAVTFAPNDFGLAMQEFMIGAMAEGNANVVDIQLRKEPYINCSEGLISLSRDVSRLRPDIRAQVIVVGTYIVGKEEVVITARAIDYTTNDVIVSATAHLKRSEHIDRLLSSREQVQLFEK